MPDLPKSDGVWRVYRFETGGGKYAEAASNKVGPEQIPVPPGYRFVSSTPMVPAEVTDEMVITIRDTMAEVDMVICHIDRSDEDGVAVYREAFYDGEEALRMGLERAFSTKDAER